MAMSHERSRDRRAERTERLLREALATLIHEKPYDAIAVKEILARADVGRSTFYAHFRDKDELLASCVHDVFGAANEAGRSTPTTRRERALGFSRRVLEFHERHRGTVGSMDADTRAVLHERLERLLAARIADDMRADDRRRDASPVLPPDLLARHVASTFGLVLGWWLESGDAVTPRDADARFRALVAPALDTAG